MHDVVAFGRQQSSYIGTLGSAQDLWCPAKSVANRLDIICEAELLEVWRSCTQDLRFTACVGEE